ncbi:MAG: D-aminoacyl-tRNA deacylase [Ignavibacteria bacterium]|nr:D-aminoacyl-tRNA deacylase [Ignavibacteria bacterium]
MRAIVQRVSEGGVYISAENYKAEIGKGMVILLGIKSDDNEIDLNFVADKCANLRIFPRSDASAEDENEKMNLSLKDIDGEVLIISQFTLYGDTHKGNRPSFTDAARPEVAIPIYDKFINRMKFNLGEEKVKTGIFGAMMEVKILNDGPVTIFVESKTKVEN